jgi:Ca2+/Na+ antiporter
MSAESPLSLRESLRMNTGIVAVALFVFVALYAVLIVNQLLVVVYVAFLSLLLWLLYRFVRAHERIAVAQERRAAVASDDGRAAGATTDGVDRPASGVAEPGDEADREHDREE